MEGGERFLRLFSFSSRVTSRQKKIKKGHKELKEKLEKLEKEEEEKKGGKKRKRKEWENFEKVPVVKVVPVNREGKVELIDEFTFHEKVRIEKSLVLFVRKEEGEAENTVQENSEKEFDKVAQELRGRVQAVKVDCDKSQVLCGKFRVEKFPSVGIFHDEFFFPLEGEEAQKFGHEKLLEFAEKESYESEHKIRIPRKTSGVKAMLFLLSTFGKEFGKDFLFVLENKPFVFFFVLMFGSVIGFTFFPSPPLSPSPSPSPPHFLCHFLFLNLASPQNYRFIFKFFYEASKQQKKTLQK